jgi:hypothetical protein
MSSEFEHSDSECFQAGIEFALSPLSLDLFVETTMRIVGEGQQAEKDAPRFGGTDDRLIGKSATLLFRLR